MGNELLLLSTDGAFVSNNLLAVVGIGYFNIVVDGLSGVVCYIVIPSTWTEYTFFLNIFDNMVLPFIVTGKLCSASAPYYGICRYLLFTASYCSS